jgi:hypothetical protein
MPIRTLEETMADLGDLLNEFDQIARGAHARFRAYQPADIIELDSRAQATCTYCHMVAEAERRFTGKDGIRPFEINGLKLWFFEKENVVVRLKKMDEDGLVRNYPTKQAKDFDRGYDLSGLPMPPVRLTAGYFLDPTGTNFIRTQIARPMGCRRTMWVAAVVPQEERNIDECAWRDVTRQGRL